MAELVLCICMGMLLVVIYRDKIKVSHKWSGTKLKYNLKNAQVVDVVGVFSFKELHRSAEMSVLFYVVTN